MPPTCDGGWCATQPQRCMAMHMVCYAVSIISGGKLGISPINLGPMYLFLSGCRRKPPQRNEKIMIVFFAKCVHII